MLFQFLFFKGGLQRLHCDQKNEQEVGESGAFLLALPLFLHQGLVTVSSLPPDSRLAHAVDEASSELDYSEENYAYGSTPFSSWMKVRWAAMPP